MRTTLVLSKFLFLCLAMLTLAATSPVNDVEGTWAYEASGTPPEYAKGEIKIDKVEGKYKVVLTIGQMALNVDEVSVDDQKVDFSLYIEDSKIDVSLQIEGDKLTGKAVSYDGTFPLKGMRKK